MFVCFSFFMKWNFSTRAFYSLSLYFQLLGQCLHILSMWSSVHWINGCIIIQTKEYRTSDQANATKRNLLENMATFLSISILLPSSLFLKTGKDSFLVLTSRTDNFNVTISRLVTVCWWKQCQEHKRCLFNLLVFEVSSEQRNNLVPKRKMVAPLSKHWRVKKKDVEKEMGEEICSHRKKKKRNLLSPCFCHY